MDSLEPTRLQQRCSRLDEVWLQTRGCSSMVELQPSKLAMRVRSPSPAPTILPRKPSDFKVFGVTLSDLW